VAQDRSRIQAEQDGDARQQVPLDGIGIEHRGGLGVHALAQPRPPAGAELGADVLDAVPDAKRLLAREDTEARRREGCKLWMHRGSLQLADPSAVGPVDNRRPGSPFRVLAHGRR
jgi:hypothetical protein